MSPALSLEHRSRGQTAKVTLGDDHAHRVYGQPAALNTRNRAIVTWIIVSSVVIAGVVGVGVVAARRHRAVGPPPPVQRNPDQRTAREFRRSGWQERNSPGGSI